MRLFSIFFFWEKNHECLKLFIYGGFHKWWVPLHMDGLQWNIILKCMIWGYPHFRKLPYIYIVTSNYLKMDW